MPQRHIVTLANVATADVTSANVTAAVFQNQVLVSGLHTVKNKTKISLIIRYNQNNT